MLKKRWLYIGIVALLVVVFCYIQNNLLTITKLNVRSEKLPSAFDGYTIVHLSDLHSKDFGKALPEKIEKEKPDIIVFTGDLVDARRYEEEVSLTLMKRLVAIAPTYFVTGNHEWSSGQFAALEVKLRDAGVQVLRNEAMQLTRAAASIRLLGIDDPLGSYDEGNTVASAITSAAPENAFTLLLSHRPEWFSVYVNLGVDVVFSGHAHGGQVRIPFVGGLIAPNQGWLPAYTAGAHQNGATTMIVSRGLGNSVIPQRVFNRPEIVVVTLRR
ncbi:metallophosphoesterase [Ectobacillus antri]|uniref:Metallophosphoesterase n=1 Tax=Ectobacillus antri TaxID=2486280 RepID=A0ABT6H6U0_9BACI|nr:metallophosphoesterase [Ectobacillus antri]MDG4657758.1 metallophosphoesterase [Ectobacillus antri]MDG5754765.1 metallophosphoesterase [Ectobacillus antri]